MPVKSKLSATLLALGAGVVVQRLCQLLGFLLIGHALGVAALGRYAEGQALAGVLTVLAAAGGRNLTARRLAAAPGQARSVVRATVASRLRIGALALVIVNLVCWSTSPTPWFWVLCTAQVIPAAFDLKQLADVTGGARREVALETGVAGLQLLLVIGWCVADGADVTTLAAIALLARGLYAARAVAMIRELADHSAAPAATAGANSLLGQTAHELLTIGDVWLVAVTLGAAPAGYYAFASRLATAALMPSVQLARLLLPHLLHAGVGGDSARALGTALRATAFATWPMLAGGIVAAEALCRLGGNEFAAAAPTLQLLLLAGCMQHLGWQCSNTLLALYRDRACAHTFLWPAVLQMALLALVPWLVPAEPAASACVAAAVCAIAQALYAVATLVLSRATWRERSQNWLQPLGVAAATLLATAAGAAVAPPAVALPAQLLAGGLAFAFGLWAWELRGRWRRLGQGLVTASGFHS